MDRHINIDQTLICPVWPSLNIYITNLNPIYNHLILHINRVRICSYTHIINRQLLFYIYFWTLPQYDVINGGYWVLIPNDRHFYIMVFKNHFSVYLIQLETQWYATSCTKCIFWCWVDMIFNVGVPYKKYSFCTFSWLTLTQCAIPHI